MDGVGELLAEDFLGGVPGVERWGRSKKVNRKQKEIIIQRRAPGQLDAEEARVAHGQVAVAGRLGEVLDLEELCEASARERQS